MANAVIKVQQTHGSQFRGTCEEWAGVYTVKPTPGEAYDEAYRQIDRKWVNVGLSA